MSQGYGAVRAKGLVIGAVLLGVGTTMGCDDPAAPVGVITDLTATAIDPWEVELRWTDTPGEVYYDVYRSREPGFAIEPETNIARNLAAGTTLYTDDGVLEETTYYYRVIARGQDKWSTSNQATVETPTPQEAPLAADAFSRLVAPGWGTADIGGAWEKDDYGPLRVDGSAGLFEIVDTIPQHNVFNELSTYGRYVDGRIRFSIDRAPDGGFHTVGVYARRDDDDGPDGRTYYRFNVMAFADGHMVARIEKEVDGDHGSVTDTTTLPVNFGQDQWYWIRWEATGTQPTTLRMKVWADGGTEPAIWNLDTEHSDPGLDVKGTTGVRIQAAAHQQTFPVIFAFDDLDVRGD